MDDTKPLRFHWSLSAVGAKLQRSTMKMEGAPDVEANLAFCKLAEECGIESLLMAFRIHRPDPFNWSAALGAMTDKIKFMVAMRSGISSPTYFVQQVNTLSALTNGRVCINIVNGRAPVEQRYYGDYLDHDGRYDRTDEFWQICHALWRNEGPVDFAGKYYQVEGAKLTVPFVSDGPTRPEIYLGGSSEQAMGLASRQADCLLTFPDRPEALAERFAPVLDSGTDVGLIVSIIAGRTRDEALDAAQKLIAGVGEKARETHKKIQQGLDSVGLAQVYDQGFGENDWVTKHLWVGAVPYLGQVGTALVGSTEDIVDAIFEYRAAGINQFLFLGFPDEDQMRLFGEAILPAVREREQRLLAGTPVAGR